jgi:pyruvate dehydrogenase E2 component (dihydrolipoamide acetyltransferase)
MRPVVIDGAVAVRPMMTATLSADHRAVDGAAGARFLTDLRDAFDSALTWTSNQ